MKPIPKDHTPKEMFNFKEIKEAEQLRKYYQEELIKGGYGDIPDDFAFWCEEKFKHSPWIAEFWNSMTNIPFVLIGIIYLLKAHHQNLRKRHQLALFFVCIVGIGSFLFHSTMRHDFQLLDEMPMMCMTTTGMWSLLNLGIRTKKYNLITAALIIIPTIIGVAIYLYTKKFEIWTVIFAASAVGCYIISFIISIVMKKRTISRKCEKGLDVRKGFFWSAVTNAIAYLLWNLDHIPKTCIVIRNLRNTLEDRYGIMGKILSPFLEFHAIWHIMTALGLLWFMTSLTVLDSYRRSDHLEEIALKLNKKPHHHGYDLSLHTKFFIFPLIYKSGHCL